MCGNLATLNSCCAPASIYMRGCFRLALRSDIPEAYNGGAHKHTLQWRCRLRLSPLSFGSAYSRTLCDLCEAFNACCAPPHIGVALLAKRIRRGGINVPGAHKGKRKYTQTIYGGQVDFNVVAACGCHRQTFATHNNLRTLGDLHASIHTPLNACCAQSHRRAIPREKTIRTTPPGAHKMHMHVHTDITWRVAKVQRHCRLRWSPLSSGNALQFTCPP